MMITRLFLATGLTFALSACAVLTIDVDVYKGPLANHEEVQLEQMAAMAIGAKPLLEKLCQSLEVEHLKGEHKKGESLESKNRPDCSTPGIKLHDQRATSVQTVLSLYRDLYPPEIANLVNDLVSTASVYKSVYTDLLPGENAPLEEDQQLWSDSQPAMWDTNSAEYRAEHRAIKEATDVQKEEVAASLKYLKDAYEKFLLSGPTEEGKRDIDLIHCGHARLYEALGKNSEKWLKDLDPKEPKQSGLDAIYSYRYKIKNERGVESESPKPLCELVFPYEKRDNLSRHLDPTSANAEFQVLREGKLVEAHANLLFRPGAKGDRQKGLFKDRIQSIARAFMKAREAQARMLEDALQLINLIQTKPVDLGLHGKSEALLRVTAYLAIDLIRTRYLWYALENSAPEEPEEKKQAPKRAENHKRLRDLFRDKLGTNYDKLYRGEEARKQLTQVLMTILVPDSSDENNASTLLSAHNALQRKFVVGACDTSENYRPCKSSSEGLKPPPSWSELPEWWEEYKADDTKWTHPSGYHRMFGISLGRDPADLEAVKKRLRDIVQTHGALDRGRLLVGLDLLTENYLTLQSKANDEEQARRVKPAERELHRGLVGFAEKVLFIADNLPFLEENSNGSNPLSAEVLGYGQVLQAVGNSILGQADELRQSDFHKKTLRKQAHAEIEAFHASLSPAASTIFQTLITGLNADIDRSIATSNSSKNRKADLENRKGSSRKIVDEKTRLRDDASSKQTTLETAQTNFEKRVAGIKATLTFVTNSDDPASDSARLQTHLAQKFPSSEISPQSLLEEIRAWLSVELSRYTTGPTTDRSQRLSLAQQYLEEIKTYATATLPAKPVPEALNQLRDIIRRDLKETEEALDQSIRQLADAHQKFEGAKEALTKAEGELAGVETELSEVTIGLAGEKKTTELTDALEIARAHAKKVLERGLGSETAGGNVFDQFLASIDAETAGKTDPEKTKWEHARALLSQRRPDNRTELVDRLIDKTTEGKLNSKEVFDHLIALLRHEYIQEVKKNGKEGGQAPQIEAALKSAWDLRTSFVYIRPAGAYLRSSYPTPSLQDDPALGWNNMLTQTTFRGLPIIGKFLSEPCFPFDCEFEKKEKLVAEIDKQFWQNVNKVRVTGGGRTNYVVSKDDIGNWSVKEVATDPEDIIKGAKSLALFGLGSSSGLPLLSKGARGESAVSTSAGESSASRQQSKTQLQSVYERYQTEYEQAAATAIEELKKEVGPEGIPHKIQVLWENNQSLEPTNVKQLKTLLAEARKGLDEALRSLKADSEATKSERPSRILSGLKAIHRFHNELRDGIKTLHFPAKLAESSALQAVTNVCQENLTRWMKRRQEENKSYETSILFIGEVVKPKSQ